jgi:hypothetical protein
MAGKKILFCPFDTDELSFIFETIDENRRENRKRYEEEGWNEIADKIMAKCTELIDKTNYTEE